MILKEYTQKVRCKNGNKISEEDFHRLKCGFKLEYIAKRMINWDYTPIEDDIIVINFDTEISSQLYEMENNIKVLSDRLKNCHEIIGKQEVELNLLRKDVQP